MTEGTSINESMIQYGQTQIIDRSADLLDFSSSCIDLIFFSQDYLVFNFGVTNSGENSSLHLNCLSLTNTFFQIRFENLLSTTL